MTNICLAKTRSKEYPSYMKFDPKNDARRLAAIILCSILMALNIKTFVRTGDLVPGGATGLSLLIQRSALLFLGVKVPFTVINVVLNSIPVYIGFRYIGKKFTLFSVLMIILSSLMTDLIPGQVITQDILLISIFGGLINGFVISVCLLSNATTGGTDFISIFLSDRSGVDSFPIILGFNAAILCVSGFLFGWDKALYSIIYQYTSTQVIHMLYKKYQQETLLIITDKPEDVSRTISQTSHHGATILHGEGAYDHAERGVVYSVVSSQEAQKVVKKVREIDSRAFINLFKTQQLYGRFYKKPED